MKGNCSGCEDFVAIDIDWFCQVLQINILHWVGWFQPHAMKGSSICCPGGGSCRLNVIISPFPSVCSMLAMVEKPAVQLDSDCLSEFWRNKFQSKCFFFKDRPKYCQICFHSEKLSPIFIKCVRSVWWRLLHKLAQWFRIFWDFKVGLDGTFY